MASLLRRLSRPVHPPNSLYRMGAFQSDGVGQPIMAAAAFSGGSNLQLLAERPAESRLRAELPAPQAQSTPLVNQGVIGHFCLSISNYLDDVLV